MELIEDFSNLKISALKKSKEINSSVHNVTLGPNSSDQTTLVEVENEPNKKEVKNENNIKISTKQPVLPYKKLLSELEIQRQEELQRAISFRKSEIVKFQKCQENKQKEQWHKQQQTLILQMEQQEIQILQDLEQHDKDLTIQHEKLIQYYQELAERRKKKDEELQAKEQRKKVVCDIVDTIKQHQLEFRCIYEEILNTLKTNSVHDIVKNLLTTVSHELKLLPDSMEKIVMKCKTGKVNEGDVQCSAELLQQLASIRYKMLIVIDDYNKQMEEIKKEKEKQAKIAANELPTTVPVNETNPNNSNKTQNIMEQMDKYVSKHSFHYYSQLQLFLHNYQDGYKQLAQDDAMKQFKFDCKKAVNIPVNAISAVSAQHLLDKYNRLFNLLTGKVVQIGDVQISASNHPQGTAFCTDLLAKKFVLQGDLMISSNPEAAFCYAAVILALWNDFPDFGKLLLAHFYQQCPYLVPFYIPKTIGQSDEEYYKNLGYHYIDGAVEKQDKFLKRMTGIMRLYSAILIGKLRKNQSIHPHDLVNGWRWIASILNLEPRTDITATMLHIFLETTGYLMQNTYGKEFKKIINFIIYIYLPLLKKIDSGGPVTRLEVLLQEYEQRGYFEQPSGLLPSNFW